MFDTNVHSNTPVPFPPPQGRQAVTQQTIAAVSGQQVEQQEEFMMTQAKTYLTGGAFDKEVSEFRANANLRTGYKTLDRVQPFYPGVYCIGAIPSLGKTTFSAQMADQVAETGRPVLYFSLEQTAFELYSKSLARGFFKTCERQRRANNALNGSYPTPSSTAIRNGSARFAYPAELAQQIDAYVQNVGNRVCVITNAFSITAEDIVGQTERYINQTGEKPVVIIDYLQIIAPNAVFDRGSDTKTRIDRIVTVLKKLQMKHGLAILVISSLNRQNYSTPVDFESFKESGGIEYTADVVWGLQLSILHEDAYIKEKNVIRQREMIAAAKSGKQFRDVDLVCLKNRYGIIGNTVQFMYYPANDFFCPPYDPHDPDTFI